METLLHQSKRIKVEHSYTCLDDSTFEPISVKEEDPLSLSEENDVHSMKIEISDEVDSLIKTEPIETVEDEGTEYSFEYLIAPNENEHENPSENTLTLNTVTVRNLNIGSDAEIVNINNFTVSAIASKDPLLIAKNDIQVEDKIKKPPQKRKQRGKGNNKVITDTPQSSEERNAREKENLQEEIANLKADYKSVIDNQMVLQAELGARRISEVTLKEKNTELQNQLTKSAQKLNTKTALIKELNQKIAQKQRELSIKSAYSERLKKDLNVAVDRSNKVNERQFKQQKTEFEKQIKDLKEKLVTVTLQLGNKEALLKQQEFRHVDSAEAMKRLVTSSDLQKEELNEKKKELSVVSQAFNNSVESVRNLKQRIEELAKDLARAKNSNEELQRSLLAEKNISRILVKEKEDLLYRQKTQDARLQEVDKDLVEHKFVIESLTSALTQQVDECRIQKEAIKLSKQKEQKKIQELKNRMIEMEQEVKNKVCEYCGFS